MVISWVEAVAMNIHATVKRSCSNCSSWFENPHNGFFCFEIPLFVVLGRFPTFFKILKFQVFETNNPIASLYATRHCFLHSTELPDLLIYTYISLLLGNYNMTKQHTPKAPIVTRFGI